MVNWGLFKRNFTRTISKSHPYALTMFSMIQCNSIAHNISFNPIALE